ncbi:hypothetical protein [Methylobacterium sp. 17Sr1-1]|uniref:hypothetical protein n=1 Tax=Methylobacterium sp. 17Sr1-1 TaxID=2202826 RepID=UPI0013A55729|nr:hypothetical protein [Methylobacterium sp. 17Sr1-1]
MERAHVELDGELSDLVLELAHDHDASCDALTVRTIEELRRLEDLARHSGDNRQTLQKIMSARRILGDRVDFGPIDAPGSPQDGVQSVRPFPRGPLSDR